MSLTLDLASPPSHLTTQDGNTIAYHHTPASKNHTQDDPAPPVPGIAPTIVWLGGFKSDMAGSKALALHQWAAKTGKGFARFDYFGHGQSSGTFEHGDISHWKNDALALFHNVIQGPLLLVGSSMGGWIALLAALAQPERVNGMVLIAPAPDFTEVLMWDKFDDAIREEIMSQGRWLRPTDYDDDPQPITRQLIEDGRKHLLLNAPSIPVKIPVHILQGTADDAVPWQHAQTLADKLESDDVALTLVKDGDHRLSSDTDITRLIQTVEAMWHKCTATDTTTISP